MKVLFVGGSGNISLDCTKEALRRGFEVYHLNRGNRSSLVPKEVNQITGDIRKPDEVKKLLKGMKFDAVADFIAFVPDHIKVDMEIFSGMTHQFIFISSASVYHKPPVHYIIAESTLAHNPYWKYSRDKIDCEELLVKAYREKGFPVTIVRPSHTYCERWIPLALESADFTIPKRIIDGREVIIHGDGETLWTLTHSEDFAKGFVGLIDNVHAIGETFHITSDEALSWNQIHRMAAEALGMELKPVYITSEFIYKMFPEIGDGLVGDKTYCAVFDNSKIKRVVPDFKATISFKEGIRRSVRWYDEHPEAKKNINPKLDKAIDDIISAWRNGKRLP